MIPYNISLDNEECTIETEQIHQNINDYNTNTLINNGIKIMLVNIRNLNKNHDSLLVLINSLKNKPDIIICTETRNLTCPHYFNIIEYEIYFNESKINANDGVVIYVKSNLQHKTTFETFGRIKFLSVTVTNEYNIQIKISATYRCHDLKKDEFITNLE